MAIIVRLIDSNTKVVFPELDSPQDIHTTTKEEFQRLSPIQLRAHYLGILIYGLGIGYFTNEEIVSFFEERGVLFKTEDYHPFEKKLLEFQKNLEPNPALSGIMASSMSCAFQGFAAGVLMGKENPNGFHTSPLINPINA